jgi:glycosyltransferase involved in cell wall biosynthesis
MGRKSAAIIVAPPWPNSGSANIFAAQAAAHKQYGRAVLLLLGPINITPGPMQDMFWSDVQSEMHYDGISRVVYGSTSDAMRRFRSDKSFWDWLAAGRDDSLSIRARYAARSRWQGKILDFIDSHRVDIVHVNHAFEMLLGIEVQDLVLQRTGSKPRLLCDTHDIQAKAYARRGEKNPFRGNVDKYSQLIAAELSLYGPADMLLHCSQSDAEFFKTALPHMHHKHVMPCLDPRQENKLSASLTREYDREFDFLYVGNNNFANFTTIKWLLTEVLPRVGDRAPRIAVVGRINELVRRMDKMLYEKFRPYFVGPAPDVAMYYPLANAVLAPSLTGTGCSVKFIEALCAGKTVIGTPDSIRGFPEQVRQRCAEFIFDAPQHFAEAMTKTLRRRLNCNIAARAIYDDFFHSRHYFHSMNDAFVEISQLDESGITGAGVSAEQAFHA